MPLATLLRDAIQLINSGGEHRSQNQRGVMSSRYIRNCGLPSVPDLTLKQQSRLTNRSTNHLQCVILKYQLDREENNTQSLHPRTVHFSSYDVSGGCGVRKLSLIPIGVYGYPVSLLKEVCKSSTIYIRPLQTDLSFP